MGREPEELGVSLGVGRGPRDLDDVDREILLRHPGKVTLDGLGAGVRAGVLTKVEDHVVILPDEVVGEAEPRQAIRRRDQRDLVPELAGVAEVIEHPQEDAAGRGNVGAGSRTSSSPPPAFSTMRVLVASTV